MPEVSMESNASIIDILKEICDVTIMVIMLFWREHDPLNSKCLNLKSIFSL